MEHITLRTIADLRWLSEAEGYLASVRRELADRTDEELEWAEHEIARLVARVRAGLLARERDRTIGGPSTLSPALE